MQQSSSNVSSTVAPTKQISSETLDNSSFKLNTILSPTNTTHPRSSNNKSTKKRSHGSPDSIENKLSEESMSRSDNENKSKRSKIRDLDNEETNYYNKNSRHGLDMHGRFDETDRKNNGNSYHQIENNDKTIRKNNGNLYHQTENIDKRLFCPAPFKQTYRPKRFNGHYERNFNHNKCPFINHCPLYQQIDKCPMFNYGYSNRSHYDWDYNQRSFQNRSLEPRLCYNCNYRI